MTCEIKTERRWLRSVILASTQPMPVLPWARGARNPQRKAAAPVPAQPAWRPAIAAR